VGGRVRPGQSGRGRTGGHGPLAQGRHVAAGTGRPRHLGPGPVLVRPGDPHGRIRRLAEEGRDPTADTFVWSDIAVGGPDPAQTRGFSSPDNLVFDRLGNLWMVTDISSSALNDPPPSPYAYHRNNGIFMIRVDGPDAGLAFRFGSVPNQAESTGPIWTPRQDTMFLAIQHPGEETSVGGGVRGDPTTYTSYWPHGNKTTGENPSEPLPSVIAIRRA
jgi:uncharacterized protein